MKELKDLIRNRVIDFNDSYSKEMKELHTKAIIAASAGDSQAKIYLKEMIRLRLIQYDRKYLDPLVADPLVDEIFGENWGLGKLEQYDKPDIDEVMVVGTSISYEKRGKIYKSPDSFESEEEVVNIIRRLLEYDNSVDISSTNPARSGERKNGDRVTAAIPPVAKYVTLNIRKFDSFVPKTEDLLKSGTITEEMVKTVDILIRGKANIKIVGEMGSGKSTFLKWAIGFCPEGERVGILETDFELNPDRWYPHLDFVQLRERAQINKTLSNLFEVMLRQNLKRVILGEMRNGLEIYQFLYACTRGLSGSIGTSHSMSAENVLDDDAGMIVEANLSRDKQETKKDLASAIDIVMTFRKLPSGKRVCFKMEEVMKTETGYDIKTIYQYDYDENKLEDGVHRQVNKVSDLLRSKLNAYGVTKSEINAVLG